MTKLEKLSLANEYVRAEIESGERKPVNLNPEIPEWIRWALIGTASVFFIGITIIYETSK